MKFCVSSKDPPVLKYRTNVSGSHERKWIVNDDIKYLFAILERFVTIFP